MKANSGLVGLIAGSSLLLGACTRPAIRVDTTPIAEPSYNHSVKEMITGNKVGKVTQNRARFNLERTIINENEFYVLENKFPKENELPIILYRKEDTIIDVDDMTQETKLLSPTVYIPTIVMKDGEKAHQFDFRKDGPLGISMKSAQYSTKNIGVGVVHATEQERIFGPHTVVMPLKNILREFYTPRIEDSKATEEGKLNFYLTDVDGAHRQFLPDGMTLRIWTDEGIYQPRAESIEKYQSRAKELPKKEIPMINLPGQVDPASVK